MKKNKQLLSTLQLFENTLFTNEAQRKNNFLFIFKFKSIILKYIYGYKAKQQYFKLQTLKNKQDNLKLKNFSMRFLWELERSINILLYRINFSSSIFFSNFIIRYGFLMVNKNIIQNPYYLSNIYDVIQIIKKDFFIKYLFLNFSLFEKFKKNLNFFYEVNFNILALCIFRTPNFFDYLITIDIFSTPIDFDDKWDYEIYQNYKFLEDNPEIFISDIIPVISILF
jgi:hypothetical protein